MTDTDPSLQHITAILLAGGQATRMGCNKAWLDYQGQPLWRHMHDLLLQAGCKQVLISGAMDGDDGIAGAVPDPVAGLGPLAGIAAVIDAYGDALADAWLLVVPVDLPRLTADTLRLLAMPGDQVAAAHFRDQNRNPYQDHALPALFHNTVAFRQHLSAALRATDHRKRSVTALHAALGARAIVLPPTLTDTLTNTNTPAEWAALTTGSP